MAALHIYAISKVIFGNLLPELRRFVESSTKRGNKIVVARSSLRPGRLGGRFKARDPDDACPCHQRPHPPYRHLLLRQMWGAMTLRTGKGSAGGVYRYYTCSTKARQGKTGCEGRSTPMDRLDQLVASHLEDRLLRPERARNHPRQRSRPPPRARRVPSRAPGRTQQADHRNRPAAQPALRSHRVRRRRSRRPGLKDRIAGLKASGNRPAPTPSAPRRRLTMRATRLSAPIW